MSDIKDLANQLNEQVKACQQTQKELVELAHKSNDHELKWLVLTEIGGHLSGDQLSRYTELLKKKTESL